ncbi:hypothetical protein GCM10010279_57250 [Streptomyces mutabilis]|nr:hypothetical protein GCM10010279_57250 [Streptomyces mutabilis]
MIRLISGVLPVPRAAPLSGVPAAGRADGRRHRSHRGDGMKKAYEAPTLVRLGSFREKTGLLQRNGNDRLILSKN